MVELQEPKGVGFYDTKDGVTIYAKLEPTIAAYINSSDMGINASRGQDFGHKLSPDWVKKVREFRRDASQMQMLATRLGGQKPTTVQILYFIYVEQLRDYEEQLQDQENPFEDEYQRQINEGKKSTTKANDDISDLIDNAIVEDEDAPAVLTAEEQEAEDAKLLAEMEAEEAKARAAGARSVAEVEAEEKAAKAATAKAPTTKATQK